MSNHLRIRKIDHLRFLVGNARQSAFFYRNAFGFDIVGYAGLETKVRHEAGYVLKQGDITFVLTSPLSPAHADCQRLVHHGDAVQDIAFEVENVESAYHEAVCRGAKGVREPTKLEDQFGVYEVATIGTYGETQHSLVNHDGYNGMFAPGYRPMDRDRYSPYTFQPAGLTAIDHIVGNVEQGQMEVWVEFYHKVLGFEPLVHFNDQDISNGSTALMSKVVQGGNGRIKLAVNEPARRTERSHVDLYLDFNAGPGVQHIAFATDDILKTVRKLRARDVTFSPISAEYYERLPRRIGSIAQDLAELAKLGILADRDEEGYLLQIFTAAVEDRPTLFYEIIQREGCQGFGLRNFQELYVAKEREKELFFTG